MEICELVWSIRREVVQKGWAEIDSRANVLPHLTVTYLKGTDDVYAISELGKKLEGLLVAQTQILKIKEIGYFRNKAVMMFDPDNTRELVEEIDRLVGKMSENMAYVREAMTPVGDHIKIVREILDGKMDDIKTLLEERLPEIVEFDRVALIGYGCEEKDIRWQRKLH
jgi:2'-5' RNA ligase